MTMKEYFEINRFDNRLHFLLFLYRINIVSHSSSVQHRFLQKLRFRRTVRFQQTSECIRKILPIDCKKFALTFGAVFSEVAANKVTLLCGAILLSICCLRYLNLEGANDSARKGRFRGLPLYFKRTLSH